MKTQLLYISIFQFMVFVVSPGLVFAGSNEANESTQEVTYTDASSSDIREISKGIRKWVTKQFAGERKIESLDVDAIIYSSAVMEKVFMQGSFYVKMTINGDKLPGMVMCRTVTGIEMVPYHLRVPIDLVTPQHINKRFKITNKEDAILFHKALVHFYDRSDPDNSYNREAKKAGDIWTLADILENPTEREYMTTERGYKVKVDAEGKVLEISRYSIYSEER
jgi:hypothetical protein